MCPGKTYQEAGSCVAQCGHDDHCPNNEKCCSNGCGTQCTTPITDDCKYF